MNRLAAAAFVSLMAVVGLVAWRVAEPRAIVTESDNRDLWETIAAGEAAQAAALTPTPTVYYTPTSTRTPKPATHTPYPTYASDVPPGYYVVPRWTEVPVVAATTDVGMMPCTEVTPDEYTDQSCEVGT
jgi:hypothetical protein